MPKAAESMEAYASESTLIDAVQSGAHLGDSELLDAMMTEEEVGKKRTRFQRFIDWYLPDELRKADLDVRRRSRFVIIIGMLTVPFYGVLVQQLISHALYFPASMAAMAAVATLLAVVSMRLFRSHVVPGSIVCSLISFVIFYQALADAGLNDPILYWSALVPLAAALAVGPRLAVICVGMNIAGVVTLYVLTTTGYDFPRVTPESELQFSALLSVTTATLFALIWGWFYEGHTLKELRGLNTRLSRFRAALARSEERYRSLFDNVPLGVYRSTPEGEILVVNTALIELLGYDSVEDIQRLSPNQDIYAYSEQRKHFRDRIEKEGEVSQFSTVWRRRDGVHIHVRENARAVFDANGNAIYYEGTVEDVTAQRRVQQALRKSEERFRSLVQHASDVITVLDADGRITYMSPSIKRVLGYDAEELIGETPFVFIGQEDHHKIKTMFTSAREKRGEFAGVEFVARHVDGHDVYIESVGANLLHDVNVGGIVLNSRDITERKRAEVTLRKAKEQAEEVARLKSNFLANMSHEIRTPLTGILGFASILAEEVVDEEQFEFVTLIEKSGNRLMETLNSVLDLARIEAGRMNLTSEPIVIADAIGELIRMLQPVAQDRNIRLTADTIDPNLEVLVDVGAVNRVLTNIIGNGIKFTDEGGVNVSVEADNEYASIRVSDTGVGIDSDFLPKLFNEFEQESTGIGRSHEGSGLGLTITRELVERMKGSISVESEKGVGTTFTIRLPRVPSIPVGKHEPSSIASPQEVPTVMSDKRQILIVDDNSNTRLLLTKMLSGSLDVDAAGTPEEALEFVRNGNYEAILMDINLGAKVSGEDVMGMVRDLAGYERVPIIAFTAYALPGDRERFLNAGFDGYLSKPFTKKELLDVFDEMIDSGGDGAVTSRVSPMHMIIRAEDSKLDQLTPGQGLDSESADPVS